MTVRLPEAQAEALDTVAEVDGLPIVEVVRLAITEYIDNRRRDPGFQQRLRHSMARARRARDRLRWPETEESGGGTA
jgi:hypothetical protein